MQIDEILRVIEHWAPPQLQESYDNCGLITGLHEMDCSGILCTLDVTEAVIDEAIHNHCNLIVAHHPLIFKPIKKLSGNDFINRILLKAIKNDIAIYALHTNLDNIKTGVNKALAHQLGLQHSELSILLEKVGHIAKLTTYTPNNTTTQVNEALFGAGAGSIGMYEECAFVSHGHGSFKPLEGTNPFIGEAGGQREVVEEAKIEVIFPIWKQSKIIAALKAAHPYEEVAYQITSTQNAHQEYGSGMIGKLEKPLKEEEWLYKMKETFGLPTIRHSRLTGKLIHKIAFCGGAGSFLIPIAVAAGADAFVTGDLKYHDYFEADNKLLLVDIGHGESELCTIKLMADYLTMKFPTFAVLKTGVTTNPVYYS